MTLTSAAIASGVSSRSPRNLVTASGRSGANTHDLFNVHCVVRDAAFRMGDQRAISAFTRRVKLAGVLSCLAGIDPPRSARRFRTDGSSSALSNALDSLVTISLGVPFGAKIPAQMLI